MIRSAALALILLAAAPSIHAAVFDVTKTADTLDGACDSDCSLREAVSAANFTPEPDILVVPAGTYTLTRAGAGEELNATGDLDVTGELILVGAGAGSTVLDGAGLDRVLDIQARAEVFGVTVRNGRVDGDGGGILVRPLGLLTGDLLLRRSVVSGNQAQHGGSGGGIAVDWLAEVRESAVVDNHAEGDGGGIAVGGLGNLIVRNATLSGNAADGSGGGLFFPEGQEVFVLHSTVAFNRAQVSGGGVHASSSLFPQEALARISGSIAALNTAPEDPDCRSVFSAGWNVFGIGESCVQEPTDKSGTGAAPLDPKLAPLSGAFGPTPVHALLEGSPALNASGVCEPADQVGQPRGVLCDSGAWERVEHPACVPGGSVLCLQGGRFRVSATWRNGAVSEDAQAVPLTDDTGNYWFFSPDNLELMVKVLDGCAVTGHWWVFASGLTDRGVSLRVEDLATGRVWTYETVPGKTYPPKLDTGAIGCAPAPGGGIGVGGEGPPPAQPSAVHVVTRKADTFDGTCDHDCSLREAVAAANARSGPDVIVLAPGVYTLDRPGLDDNAVLGDLDVTGNLLVLGAGAERTVLDGGGIDRVLEVRSATEIRDVTVRNGWAQGPPGELVFPSCGGGILVFGNLKLVRSWITANRAEYGGGVCVVNTFTALDSTLSGNVADREGGGLYGDDEIRLENVTVSGNQAGEAGGGLFVTIDFALLVHVTVTGNSAPATGGAVLLDADCQILCPPAVAQLFRTVIAGNTGGSRPDCQTPYQTGGHNVFGVGDGCDPGQTDLAGTLAQPLDPRLGPLGSHGGPTLTHVPLAGSPLIDRALCPAGRDQRGRPRPDQTLCDTGSVEVLPGACQPDEDTLCLGERDRFEVTVEWTAKGQTDSGKAFPLEKDTGAFWFFDPANLELTVKVLNGCGTNGRYWVFLSGLTDVGVEVTVRDTGTGNTWTHTHAAGKPFQPRLDTDALDVCN